MFGRITAAVVAAALTVALGAGTASAATTNLFGVMSEFQPVDYWVLDELKAPALNSSEAQPPLFPFGTGPALTFGTLAHPVGGFQPRSVRFNPSGPRSGQYLRSTLAPTFGVKPGTIVIWFRIPKTLPTWTQVIAVDNGAYSGTGGGLMIDKAGHLVSEDASGFVDFRSRRTLNDNRWHMVAWVDTYSPNPTPAGSQLYLDGLLQTHSLTALWVPRLGVDGARLLLGDGGSHEARGIGRFRGNLSNVAIYDGFLGARELGDIWSVGSTGSFGAVA